MRNKTLPHHKQKAVQHTAAETELAQIAQQQLEQQEPKQMAPPAIGKAVSPWRVWWHAKTWPIRKKLMVLACMLNRHDWEDAYAVDATGEPARDENGRVKPSRFRRCKRPGCRVFSDQPQLVAVGNWLETDDFMVLARKDCQRCFGRGFYRKMVLPGAAKAKLPCDVCLRVQPRYVEHAPEKVQ